MEGHSVKLLSALLALCLGRTDASWSAEMAARPEIRQQIENDADGGGEIATSWIGVLRPILPSLQTSR
jgi:hypothetical protein